MSWLHDYLAYTADTEAPRSFHYWTGIGVLGALVGRNLLLRVPNRSTEDLPIYPNFYITLVGPPGIGKGVAIGCGRKILSSLGDTVHLASTVSSRKGLFREFENSQGDGKDARLVGIAPELARFLFGTGNVNNRGMSAEVIADLCDIYDGEDWTWTTEKDGTNTVRKPYFLLLGGTTAKWIRAVLPPAATGGGLLSRMNIVWEESEAQENPFPTFDSRKLARLVVEAHSIAGTAGEASLSPAAEQTYRGWYHEQKKDPEFRSEAHGRLGAHVLKVALVLALSEHLNLVSEAHMQEAIREVMAIVPAMDRLVGGGTDEADATAELAEMLEQTEGGVLKTDAYKRLARYGHNAAGLAINMLKKQGRISVGDKWLSKVK